jgi:CHAD domain-containing protein
MAHQRLRQQETVPENIERIILEQLDRAIDRLSSKTGSKDRAIHDARVCFKKVRAMLRLVRSEIGEETFKEENAFYRDAGRELGALRDTTVVADTLKKLVDDFAEQYAATDLKWLRKRLMSSRIDLHLDRKEVVQELAKTIESSRERVKSFPLNVDSFFAIGPGLRRVYRKGRKCFEAVRRDPSAENLHEWRKLVKHLGYQIGVLNPIWPKMLEVHAFELNKLSDYLSEDHDLVLLKTRVLEQAESISQIRDGETLLTVIGVRREQLQRKAMALGARLYAEKPKSLIIRFQTYWQEWRPTSEASRDESHSETIPSSQTIQGEVPASSSEPSGAKASAAGEPGANR